jgi:amidase
VPFLLKDIMGLMEGQPISYGSRLLHGFRSPVDSAYVRRARAAGLVLLGRTNAPEFGLLAVTEGELHGPCHNPWNPAYTPGGSSGGSGAAVAARMVPWAHANDGGGSIRIPASHCGLFGLKPTRARISLAPLGEGWSGLVTEGALTRSVRDMAALLDALSGPAPGDPYAAPVPPRPFGEEVRLPPGRLRVAFTSRPLMGTDTHPACRAAVEDAARLLESLGHHVEEVHPPLEREALVRAYLAIVSANLAAEIDAAALHAGRPAGADVLELPTRALLLMGRIVSGAELAAALMVAQRARNDMAGFMERFDVLVTPTAARPPVRLRELSLKRVERLGIQVLERLPLRKLLDLLVDDAAKNALAATPNTQLMNLTGQPAASVPLCWGEEGLPLGIQLAARFGDEGTIFRLAAQLEEARPWAGKKPPGI